ncbi:srg family chemoreceptor domain-containing protein [Ditylenchus destructor]|nr:srg family chemoreceptor domain-containing protein [Ditylenchus destructor]
MDRNESSNVADAIFAFLAGYLYYPQLSGVIPLFYAIPTFALNIFVNYIMFRHLKTPFYRLYIFSNVAQCITWFTKYYMFRAAATPFFYPIYALIPPSGWIPTFLNFITYYALYVHYFLEFLLTFNRFTVVAFPLTYARVSNSLYYVIITVIYLVFVTAMNLFICCKLFLMRKKNESGSVSNKQGIEPEFNLFLFTCYLFVLQTLVGLCQTYLFFNIRSMSMAQIGNVIFIQLYIEDVHLCLTPCFILLLSSALRDKIRSTLFKGTKFDRVLFRSVAHSSQL